MAHAHAPLRMAIMKSRDDRRRHPRLPVQLRVTVTDRSGSRDLLTDDINRGGIFIRTDRPLRVRELLEVSIHAESGAPIETVAVVRHVVAPAKAQEDGRVPGMGVQFFGMGPNTAERWDAFIGYVTQRLLATRGPSPGTQRAEPNPYPSDEDMGLVRKEGAPRSSDLQITPVVELEAAVEDGPEETLRLAPDSSPDEVRRLHPRFAAAFKVRVPTLASLEEFATRDISAGGIFLATERDVEKGTHVEVVVVHPDTGAEFPLEGEVVRIGKGTAERPGGLGIRFVDVNEETRENFNRFVRSAIPDDAFAVGDFLFDDGDI